jgi:hypothetical protein
MALWLTAVAVGVRLLPLIGVSSAVRRATAVYRSEAGAAILSTMSIRVRRMDLYWGQTLW